MCDAWQLPGLVPTIAKQATNQAVRFPVQFYAKQFLTGGDKSLDANPLYNGPLDMGHMGTRDRGPQRLAICSFTTRV